MDLSSFLRHLPLMVRLGTTLDHRTNNVSPWLIMLVVGCCSTVTICNLIVYLQRGIKDAVLYSQTYDTFLCFYMLSHIPILIQKRSEVTKLVNLLLRPIDEIPLNLDHPKIVKDYIKWIRIFGGIFIFNHFLLMCCLMMVIGPLIVLLFYPSDTPLVDYPLPMGCIPFQNDSPWIYALAYLVSASTILSIGAFHVTWSLVMVYSSLRIKALLKILCSAILSFDSRAAALRVTMRDLTATDSSASQGATIILQHAILFHLDIMEYMKEVQKTFGMSLLLFFHLAIIISALLLHNMINAPDLTMENYLVMGNIVFGATFSLGVYCFFGQNIISESHKLQWVLYECACSNQPQAIKRGLLIMMTASTRPLYFTFGGVYPLSMATFAITLQAIYSYVNILYSLRRKQVA